MAYFKFDRERDAARTRRGRKREHVARLALRRLAAYHFLSLQWKNKRNASF